MNAITPYTPAPMGLVPANMGEAMKLADMMAGAKLVPAALQKSPADCLMVIQQAVRWQMDPFAVAQECSVIQGKLMHSGKLVAAVVNARGNLAERLSFEYAGTGDNRTITVRGRFEGETKAREVVVRLGDARTSNKVWQTQPDQQLMYHGTRVWARRHAPELMLGVYSPEEFDEAPAAEAPRVMRDVTPPANVSPIRPQQAALPAVDPETGETGPRAIPVGLTDDGQSDWIAWGGLFVAAVTGEASLVNVDQWEAANAAQLRNLEIGAPKIHARVKQRLAEARDKLTPPPPADDGEMVSPADLDDPARLLAAG